MSHLISAALNIALLIPAFFASARPLPPSQRLSSLVLCQSQQLFDEKIKDCKEDESRRVSTSSRALLGVGRLPAPAHADVIRYLTAEEAAHRKHPGNGEISVHI